MRSHLDWDREHSVRHESVGSVGHRIEPRVLVGIGATDSPLLHDHHL